MRDNILELKNLSKNFVSKMDLIETIASKMGGKDLSYTLQAVTDVSLSVKRGEIFGLVGESGCGKTTIGKLLSGIYTPSSGTFIFNGKSHDEFYQSKDRIKLQLIMQDSASALNSRKKVIEIITEAPLYHNIITKQMKYEFALDLMIKIGLSEHDLYKFPHMFSGGQQQRINIARALAVNPDFIICDESVAALDVSIQAQILNLLLKLQKEYNLTLFFISHNLGVVRHIANSVAVMYLGRVVEQGAVEKVFDNPKHPYTETLLEAVPKITEFNKNFKPIDGEVPSPINPPSGCPFHPRCRKKLDVCSTRLPELIGETHKYACHLYNK